MNAPEAEATERLLAAIEELLDIEETGQGLADAIEELRQATIARFPAEADRFMPERARADTR